MCTWITRLPLCRSVLIVVIYNCKSFIKLTPGWRPRAGFNKFNQKMWVKSITEVPGFPDIESNSMSGYQSSPDIEYPDIEYWIISIKCFEIWTFYVHLLSLITIRSLDRWILLQYPDIRKPGCHCTTINFCS